MTEVRAPDVMTTKEAADFLNIKVHQLHSQRRSGEMPEDCYFKFGHSTFRYFRKRLMEWVGMPE